MIGDGGMPMPSGSQESALAPERPSALDGPRPSLTLNERDRRWANTKALMAAHDLSALLVVAYTGREHYDAYLSNEQFDGVVVFPMAGEPLGLTPLTQRLVRRMASNQNVGPPWIEDVRITRFAAGIVDAMRDLGLERARIGVVGLASWGPGEFDGLIPHGMWSGVLAALPRAAFVDVSDAFMRMMLTKSEEELALYRYSAAAGEQACRAMVEITRAGVRESDIHAAVQHAIFVHGADAWWPHLNLALGHDDLGWGPPMGIYAGGEPRRVKPGDLVQAELFPAFGGAETQQQMAIAVGPVPDLARELGAVARRAYEAGLKALRPGMTFGALCDAMFAPIRGPGEYWTLSPVVHTLGPLPFVSDFGVNIEKSPVADRFPAARTMRGFGADIVLEENMVLAFEPNVCKGAMRVNIGGTVLVTSTGAEELNSLPNQLCEVVS